MAEPVLRSDGEFKVLVELEGRRGVAIAHHWLEGTLLDDEWGSVTAKSGLRVPERIISLARDTARAFVDIAEETMELNSAPLAFGNRRGRLVITVKPSPNSGKWVGQSACRADPGPGGEDKEGPSANSQIGNDCHDPS